MLDYKLVGSNIVTFRLEDGTTVRVKVDIAKVGVAENFKNPDGTPHYNIGFDLKPLIIPPGGKYKLPKSQVRAPPTQPPNDQRKYG